MKIKVSLQSIKTKLNVTFHEFHIKNLTLQKQIAHLLLKSKLLNDKISVSKEINMTTKIK